ncbi:transcriptional regulator [Pontibacter qinzhouensis]|uniref:Transcriptional regulator n=1 Tax=Pontibacter qinzhouensis TaxID=2603253 RepID=A0A5C8JIT5_9BACT|nr:transcriptional regulator [Pontibacter qinzhouensis]TXK37689.1 transcriptional regulator [Pontibacter qinzhouensis]
MNYITHLTGFFELASKDYRLNPTHVSLYMALFLQWNLNRFKNPISVSRAEVMDISKISSRVTYHKCIKELHSWGYIHYDPSYNYFRGSLVYLLGFEKKEANQQKEHLSNCCTGAEPAVDKGCTGAEREVGPSINSINYINSKNILNKSGAPFFAGGSENEQVEGDTGTSGKERKEKSCAKEEKKEKPAPPGLEAVQAFFQAEGRAELEAFRFFHHYSANGWQLGRTPMQDWQAAAKKWMINGINENRQAYANHPGTGAAVPAAYTHEAKDYSEPL